MIGTDTLQTQITEAGGNLVSSLVSLMDLQHQQVKDVLLPNFLTDLNTRIVHNDAICAEHPIPGNIKEKALFDVLKEREFEIHPTQNHYEVFPRKNDDDPKKRHRILYAESYFVVQYQNDKGQHWHQLSSTPKTKSIDWAWKWLCIHNYQEIQYYTERRIVLQVPYIHITGQPIIGFEPLRAPTDFRLMCHNLELKDSSRVCLDGKGLDTFFLDIKEATKEIEKRIDEVFNQTNELIPRIRY